MKKLGKGLSFLTKIMLVIGLLISNLSSLSVVFAYEVTDAIVITMTEDEKLNIKYLDELAEEVENVNVNVYENYTYLDNTSLEEVASNYSLTSEELMNLEGFEVESVLSSVIFDGLYEVKVEITDTENEIIDSAIYSENVTHESGLSFKLLDSNNTEIVALEDGRYPVLQDNSRVNVVAKVLAGGLRPTDVFVYEDEEYMASDLLELEFSSEIDFNGRLYGEYILPIEVKVLNSNLEEVVYTDSLEVLYESYEMNNLLLNTATDVLEIGDSYEFSGNSKDGILYVLLNADKTNTVLDLYNLMKLTVGEDDKITYILSNSEYEDILASYDSETAEVTLEEYLETIMLDDTVVLSLVNDGLTITYKVVVVGDLNNDNMLTDDDLSGLVNQVIGESEINIEKSDLYGSDGEVNTLDVMYLDQVMKNGTWDVVLEETEATLNADLVVNSEDIVSGDEFTVSYVLTLRDYAVNGVAGLFTYSDNLELVSVETANQWLGNSNNGKFLYLGTDSLTGNVVENEDGTISMEDAEYIVVAATFKALKAGESTISVENSEYFDQNKYLVMTENDLSVVVVVNASDNNSLSSLVVAGQTITLTKDELGEDVLDYEITVGNDVTVAEVETMVENVAANVTSIVTPEELVEGTNTVTVTVTSETGDVKVYTITVVREAAPEEETTTTPVNYNNYNTYEEDTDEEDVSEVIDNVEDDEEEEEKSSVEKESNLSRIIIIILILLVIAGLVYLIFKDEDDEETKKTNKEINKLRKDEVEIEKTVSKKTNKSSSTNSKNKKSNNNKKER